MRASATHYLRFLTLFTLSLLLSFLLACNQVMQPTGKPTQSGGASAEMAKLRTAKAQVRIAPQLLTKQDEEFVQRQFQAILKDKGYIQCRQGAFCFPEIVMTVSIDPDPRVKMQQPYSPTHIVATISASSAQSRSMLYKFSTGLRWQGNAAATFNPLVQKVQSDIPKREQ